MSHLVVTYHYVRPTNSDGVTGITPGEFAEQIRLIRRSHRIVTVEEYVHSHALESNLALLTFDDAVRDQYVYAAPVMADLGVPCVLFAPMRPFSAPEEVGMYDRTAGRRPLDGASGTDPRWCTQHLLHALAEELGWSEFERRVDEQIRELGAGEIDIDTERMNRLYHYEVSMKRRMKYIFAFALPHDRATEVLHSVNAGVGLSAGDWFCTHDQLNELQSAGHALGGHGFDHIAYTTLSPMRQAADMHMAMAVMSRRFGAMNRAMAYPFGQHDAATDAIATQLGYTHQFDTKSRIDAKFLRTHLDAPAMRPEPKQSKQPIGGLA